MKANSYEQILKDLERRLQAAGIPEEDAASDAWFLFEEAFGMRRAEYFLKKSEPCTDPEGAERLQAFADGRCQRIPVQYLTGWQEFMGLTFHVDSRVLIPRGDTEVLVERVLNDQKKGLIPKDASLLDLCTGSGCIFLSLMKLGSFSLGVGTDLSPDALCVAKGNAESLGLWSEKQGPFSKETSESEIKTGDPKVYFLEGDLFEALEHLPGNAVPEDIGRFDVITANPPYIAETERTDLMPEVVLHEPEMALFADRNGLAFYERIAREAPKYLKAGGRLYLEIGCSQGEAVSRLLKETGAFEEECITVLKDLAGLSRVVSAQKVK